MAPKTDAEAVKSCRHCTHLGGEHCDILGKITVAVRNKCESAGYANYHVMHEHGDIFTGKWPRLYPNE